MTRTCPNCEFANQDDYNFCAKCGTPLIEGAKPKNVIVYKAEPRINKKAIIMSYLVTIFLSWTGFVVSLFSKATGIAFFTFFGFFLPFYLIQSPVPEIKRHGYIQLVIALLGVILSFHMIFK